MHKRAAAASSGSSPCFTFGESGRLELLSSGLSPKADRNSFYFLTPGSTHWLGLSTSQVPQEEMLGMHEAMDRYRTLSKKREIDAWFRIQNQRQIQVPRCWGGEVKPLKHSNQTGKRQKKGDLPRWWGRYQRQIGSKKRAKKADKHEAQKYKRKEAQSREAREQKSRPAKQTDAKPVVIPSKILKYCPPIYIYIYIYIYILRGPTQSHSAFIKLGTTGVETR